MDETLPTGLGDRLRQVPSPVQSVTMSEQAATRSRPPLPEAWYGVSTAEWLRGGSAILLVASAYALAALAGNALTLTGSVDAVWPPAGVGIAAVYLGGLWL